MAWAGGTCGRAVPCCWSRAIGGSGRDQRALSLASTRPPDTALRVRLRDLANQRRRFGYKRAAMSDFLKLDIARIITDETNDLTPAIRARLKELLGGAEDRRYQTRSRFPTD